MISLRSYLNNSPFSLRLLGLAVFSCLLTYSTMASLKTVHAMPPLWTADAIVLTVLLNARPDRRWGYLAAAFAGYTAQGFLFGMAAMPHSSWLTPPAVAAANMSGILTASALLRRFSPQMDFASGRDLAVFCLAAVLAGPAVSIVLVTVILRSMHMYWTGLRMLDWGFANALGMLFVVPGVMILRKADPDLRKAPLSRSAVAALAALALVSFAAFVQNRYGIRYVVPPALALVAIYLEFVGVAIGGVMIAGIALLMGFVARGPSDGGPQSADERLLMMQLYLAFIMAVNLPFAALLVQRRRMRDSLLRTKQEAEEARAEAVEQQRRSMMAEEMANVGFWSADYRTNRVEWSDQNYVIFGHDRDEPIKLGTASSYAHPEDRSQRSIAFAQLRLGRPLVAEWRAVRRNGDVRYIISRGVPEFDASGEVCGAFGTVLDVTELALAQEALKHNSARLRLITQHVADIIVQTDLEDRITYVSPSVEARLGYRPEELIGRSWRGLIHAEDANQWTGALERLLESGGATPQDSIQCRAIARDGRELWLGMRPTLVRDEETGEPIGLVDVARDVTERRRLMTDLMLARAAAEQAAAVKGEFLANMSHEIRTPLTSICGFTRLAREQADLTEDTSRYIDRISSASDALLAIVNDVLDFSKLEAGEIRLERRPVDLNGLMQDTANLFSGQSAEKGLSLSLSCGPAVPEALMIDPDRLRQILINLVGNGIKFAETGGVRVGADYDPAQQMLRVEVADTGPGIPQDRLNLLFQRFSQIDGSTTRRFGGTGLGLAICKGLIEAMGGEIGVTSREGEGSTFWFTLPAAPTALAPPAPVVVDDELLLSGLKVLVVDDNRANRELVRAVLAPMGAVIAEAEDGHGAIEQADLAVFDVILMDLRMPGMSGQEAARAVHEGGGPNRATPIVAFSADGGDEVAEAMAGHGFVDRLIKPFKPMELIQVLVNAVDQNPLEAPDADAGREVA